MSISYPMAAVLLSLPDGPAEWNPPKRYDHPYSGDLTIRRASPSKIIEACKRAGKKRGINYKPPSFHLRGCAFGGPQSCDVVILDRPYYGTTPNAILRHEMGHCNGWPSNHPD